MSFEFSFKERIKHVLVLVAFAVAQPVYDLFGRNSEYFVINRVGGGAIFLLMIGVLLIPSLMILVLEYFSKYIIKARAASVISGAFTALIISLLVSPLAKGIFGNEGTLSYYLMVVVVVFFLTTLYIRNSNIKAYIAFLWPVIIIFPVIFGYNTKEVWLTGGATGKAVGVSKNIPVVMVVFDEFPLVSLMDASGEIDKERFPGFYSLSQNATWYKNGTTITSWTERAVPVVLSGKVPDTKVKQLPSISYYPQNLFTLLSDSHEMHVFEQVTQLCPDAICKSDKDRKSVIDSLVSVFADTTVVYLHQVLPNNLKGNLPEIAYTWGDFLNANKTVEKPKSKKGLVNKGDWADDVWLFDQFIQSIKDTDVSTAQKPGLYAIHITFPHVPYRYLPSGKKYFKDMDKRNDKGYKTKWDKDEIPTLQAMQRFLMQAVVADSLIKELVETLKEVGLFEKAIIVVTADHGTSFQPLEFSRRVSNKNYMDVLPVPYFIKYPLQKESTKSARNVETQDILPTISDVLGITAPNGFDGISAIGSVAERPFKEFYRLEKGPATMKFKAEINFEPTLTRMHKYFGFGATDKLFEFGPKSELLGLTLEEAKKRNAQIVKADIDKQDELADVDLSAEFVPAFISGQVQNKEVGIVAIALNGKIVATTWIDKDNGKFSAIVSEKSFINGKNEVVVVAVK